MSLLNLFLFLGVCIDIYGHVNRFRGIGYIEIFTETGLVQMLKGKGLIDLLRGKGMILVYKKERFSCNVSIE